MKQQPITKQLPYSLLTTMYSSWQQYKIPAIYYHYLLSVLPKQDKKKQLLLMAKQIKSIKANTHPYHKIINLITARERSLDVIRGGLGVFREYQSTSQMEWPVQNGGTSALDMQFDVQNLTKSTNPKNAHNKYTVKHQDPNSPIISPNLSKTESQLPQKHKQTKLQQLLNHIKLYQKITLQIIYLITQWQNQLKQLGYNQSVISFQYKKQDYLELLNRDTIDILDNYQSIFQNNPFLIMKKYHEKTEYALIYKELKFVPDLEEKVDQCINIIAGHEAEVLKFRMLGKIAQSGNFGKGRTGRRMISKSSQIDKVYNNYNYGKDYIVVRDVQIMKKSKIYEQPRLSRLKVNESNLDKNLSNNNNNNNSNNNNNDTNNRIKQLKNTIIINPQARLLTIDKTVRKHPVSIVGSQADILNLVNKYSKGKAKDKDRDDLLAQEIPVYLKSGQESTDHSLVSLRRNKTQKILDSITRQVNKKQNKNMIKQSNNPDNDNTINKLKRNQTYDHNIQPSMIKKHSSEILSDSQQKNKQLKQRIQVRPVNNQNNIVLQSDPQSQKIRNRDDEVERNKGYSLQRKIQVVGKVDKQLKLKNGNYQQDRLDGIKKQRNQLAFVKEKYQENLEKLKPVQTVQAVNETKKQSQIGQLSQDSEMTLLFQQNIKPTQIVKYLRTKVFNTTPINTSSSSQTTFQQIQSIAKRILAQKQLITLIRVQYRNMKIAWLAVKFIEKDNTMRRCVHIIYVRKFVKLSGFQRKLLDNFVANGYGLVRNQQKILYEVQLLDVVVRPLIKIKYKVNPTIQKPQLKKLMKKYNALGQSRILKYHSYSKTSKYHNYCQHDKSYCMISFNFLEISKICIDKHHYIQAKADRISKIGQGMYRISCAVNQTDLVVANTLTDIISLEKESQIEKDSSFDSKCQTSYRYIAIRQGKVMRKYMIEGDDPAICQFVTVNGSIPEVRSIAMSKQDVKESVLLFNPPYFMAIMTKDAGECKTLAIIQFQ